MKEEVDAEVAMRKEEVAGTRGVEAEVGTTNEGEERIFEERSGGK